MIDEQLYHEIICVFGGGWGEGWKESFIYKGLRIIIVSTYVVRRG